MTSDNAESLKFRDIEGYKDGETHLVSFIQGEHHKLYEETEKLNDAMTYSWNHDEPNISYWNSVYAPQIEKNEERMKLLKYIAREKGSVLVKSVENYINTLREEFETKMGEYEDIIQQFNENSLDP
ncbi:hypothetical protein GQ472_06490 [archaeon]|nr:hypothetical protein [archaeon]